MRHPHPVLLAPVLCLLSAEPAATARGFMSVQDFQFAPRSVAIQPGEKVDFNFEGPTAHTATLRSGQTDRYDSGFREAGRTTTHRFSHPGLFRLYCIPHPQMTARVQVGTRETTAPRITELKAARGDGSVRLTFHLSERSVVSVAAGQKRLRRVVGAGRSAITVTGLRPGRRTARLQARDGWANEGAAVGKSFRVR